MIALILSILGIGGIAALIFIPGALPALVKAATALWEAICKYPREAIILGLCGACWWLWIGWGNADDRADAWKRAHDLRVKAEELASAAQKKRNAQIQSTYEDKADAAQERHDARSVRVRDATGDYIHANRLHPGQCAPGQSDPAPATSGPAVPENAPASPVMVAERDVETCAANYSYALSAYEWAGSLLKAGVAK